jgi:hypothetical protein
MALRTTTAAKVGNEQQIALHYFSNYMHFLVKNRRLLIASLLSTAF